MPLANHSGTIDLCTVIDMLHCLSLLQHAILHTDTTLATGTQRAVDP